MNKKIIALVVSFFLLCPSHAAMTFDGASQYVTVTNNSSLNFNSSYTVMAWIKSSSSSSEQSIVTKFLITESYSGFLLSLGCCANTGIPSLWVGDLTNSWAQGNTAVNDGRWHHIAGRLSGTTATIFIDGVIDATRTRTPNIVTTGDLNIGRRFDTGAYFPGDIDDVRLYNRALSDSEIESIGKSRGRLLITDGLIGWWKLDQGSDGATATGATVSDSTGNGNTGTPTGSPTWKTSTFINYP
jgi:hypothetical protein